MRKIETVFFDAGFTLIKFATSLGSAYAGIARDLGITFPAERFEEVAPRVWVERHLPRYRQRLESSDEIERQFWRDYNRLIIDELQAEGFAPDFEAWFGRLQDYYSRPETWTPLAGARQTLAALEQRGYVLGVISNWDSRLPGVLDGLDLSRFFKLVLTSAEAGYRKPSPHIFEAALARLDTDRDACLHVGDSLEDDVEGARAAGIRAVHLAPGRASRPAAPTPVIASLPELLGLLDGLS